MQAASFTETLGSNYPLKWRLFKYVLLFECKFFLSLFFYFNNSYALESDVKITRSRLKIRNDAYYGQAGLCTIHLYKKNKQYDFSAHQITESDWVQNRTTLTSL
jgi:hypothetical protein